LRGVASNLVKSIERREFARVGNVVRRSGSRFDDSGSSARERESFCRHCFVRFVAFGDALPHAHAYAEKRRLCFCRERWQEW
jgi:hypothetical protein